MRHVISEHFFLDAPERGAHGRDLRDDIDAIAVLVDHLGQAADLALDPAQAFLTGCLDVFAHALYIPLQGMGYKRILEKRMAEAENQNSGRAAKNSGGGSKATAAPAGATAKTGCCGGHDHSGHGHHGHQTEAKARV